MVPKLILIKDIEDTKSVVMHVYQSLDALGNATITIKSVSDDRTSSETTDTLSDLLITLPRYVPPQFLGVSYIWPPKNYRWYHSFAKPIEDKITLPEVDLRRILSPKTSVSITQKARSKRRQFVHKLTKRLHHVRH